MRILRSKCVAMAAALSAVVGGGAEASEPPDGTVLLERVIDIDPGGPPHEDSSSELVVDLAGRIVVGGSTHSGAGSSRVALARLLPNGEFDSSFGDGGLLRDAVPSVAGSLFLRGQVFDPSTGRILIAGWIAGSPAAAFVARLLDDGSPDPSFGDGGVRRVEAPTPDRIISVRDLVLLPAGSTLLVVSHEVESEPVSLWLPALARLTVDGDLDPTFDGDGYKVVPLGTGHMYPTTANRQTDGRILLGIGSTANFRVSVARLLENGDPDPSFGVAGIREIPFRPGVSYTAQLNVVLPSDDGKVLAAGDVCLLYDRFLCFDEGWGIARLLATGQLDESFGDGGLRIGGAHCWDEPCPTYFDYGFTDAVEQGDGRILVTGVIHVSGEDSLVSAGAQRLLTEGAVDPSFGLDGIAVVDFARPEGPASSEGNRIALTAEGRIAVLGDSVLPPTWEFRRWAVASLSNSYLFADGFDTGSTRNWTLGEEP